MKKTRTGKFVHWYDTLSGQHYFHLKASNGRIVCQSEGYNTKRACLNGIDAVIAATKDYPVIDLGGQK